MAISKPMNKLSVSIVKEIIDHSRELKISVHSIGGATVIDMGVKTEGSFDAGIYLSRVCMGGLANVVLSVFAIEDVILPSVIVSTDYPIEACMASQFAGWRIKVGEYFAMGSGPARVLAKKPKKLFDEIGYSEESDEAVLVLEADKLPTEDVVKYISNETRVQPNNLYILVAPTNSLPGAVQVSARIVETGIHKLHTIGFNIKKIIYGFGSAPIAPLHPDMLVMLGRTNDMLLYAGYTYYIVDYEDENQLKEFINKTPSTTSKDYGVSMAQKVSEIGIEFLYKVDPAIFAPAYIEVNNIRSGKVFRAGRINIEILKKSIGLTS